LTADRVHKYNTSRLMHRLGLRAPAEVEAEYYQRLHTAEHPGHRSDPPALRAVDMKRKFGTWGRAKEAFVHWLNRWIAERLSLRA